MNQPANSRSCVFNGRNLAAERAAGCRWAEEERKQERERDKPAEEPRKIAEEVRSSTWAS